jgi:hypothetical protein
MDRTFFLFDQYKGAWKFPERAWHREITFRSKGIGQTRYRCLFRCLTPFLPKAPND